MVNIDDKRIQKAFLEEVTELLENLNRQLLLLEESPEDKNIINEIFRMTHSIKSESALVGFKNISTISHKMEDIFERVRRGVLKVTREIIDRLFSAYDKIIALISVVQNGGNESEYDIEDVINPLYEILNEKPAEKKITTTDNSPQNQDGNQETFGTRLHYEFKESHDFTNPSFTDMEKAQIDEGLQNGESFYQITFHLQDDCDMRYPRSYLVYNNFLNQGTVLKTVPDIHTETEDDKFQQMVLYFLSNRDLDQLKDCAEVDQVDRIQILRILDKNLKVNLGLHEGVITESMVSSTEIDEAERLEMEWMKQLEEEQKKKESQITEKLVQQNTLKEPIINTEIVNKAVQTEEGLKEDKKTLQQNQFQQKEVQKQTIRVDIERLDVLMNLVGELIINRSRFLQIKDRMTDQSLIQELKTDLDDATNELERITDQMQIGMMQARMVPIGNVFSKFPRMVRDLANTLQKNVDLEIIGETTEIDRTVIELIADPLTHLIRNAIDHGLESPEDRQKSGKSRVGKVVLRAYQEGSSIYIEVSDDGGGINSEIIREKALEKGLINAQQSLSMTSQELLNLIFEPGFSTKKEVSNLSGRGVGMDVVRTQIEKLRGRVDISTLVGEGTKFTITLPLTLTIVEALLVNVQKNIFAIPISVVEETIKVKMQEIEEFDDYQVYNLRNETLAVLWLSGLVGLPHEKIVDDVYIVVVSYERRKIGLIVNDLIGEQDIVIKALDDVLKNNEGIAGASVLGDGRVALILDTSTLVKSTLREINLKADQYSFYDQEELEELTMGQLFDKLNPRQLTEMEALTENADKPDGKLPYVEEVKDDDKNLNLIQESLKDIGFGNE